MTTVATTQGLLNDLSKVSSAGYAIALHVRFTTPTYLFQTYPADWMEYYSSQGLVMHDPTVKWGFENDGTVRWADLAESDSAGVLTQAAEHGLSFGITMAVSKDGSKSLASFSRSDRDFTDDEAKELVGLFEKLHDETADTSDQSVQDALKKLSVELTHATR